MSVLSWGKPTIKIADLTNGYPADESGWTTLPTPVQGTVQLDTAEGDTVQALEEGGGVVDSYTNKSQYTLNLELFVKKNEQKPIEDNDGVVVKNYAVRIIPEDPAATGYEMRKASVSCRDTMNSQDGGRVVYSFKALVPDDNGKMLRYYIAQQS